MKLGIHVQSFRRPTEAQKEAGNYKKAHIRLHGLEISIENPKGSVRSGESRTGQKWSVVMKHHYGYIRGFKGADKEHIDVFVGPHPESEHVWIINQSKADGTFDEHKVMLGFDSEQAAREGYLANYTPGWDRIKSVKAMSIDEFKTWLKEGDTEAVAKSISYDEESEIIRANKKTAEAGKLHKFKPGRWLTKNGHPRCLLCGDEPTVTGYCNNPFDGSFTKDGFRKDPNQYQRPPIIKKTLFGVLLKAIRDLPLSPSKKNPAVRRHQKFNTPAPAQHHPHPYEQNLLGAGIPIRETPVGSWLMPDGRGVGDIPSVSAPMHSVYAHIAKHGKEPDDSISSYTPELKELLDAGWIRCPVDGQTVKQFEVRDIMRSSTLRVIEEKLQDSKMADDCRIEIDDTTPRGGATSYTFTARDFRNNDFNLRETLRNVSKSIPLVISIDKQGVSTFRTNRGDSSTYRFVIDPFTFNKAIIQTPRMPGSNKIDWEAVPVGASIWITVTDPSSPLHGRHILITKRADNQAVIDPGEARRHGYKVGSWADEATGGMRGMAHAAFQMGKLKEQEKDVERLKAYRERLKEREPYEKRLREIRSDSSARVRDVEEKFISSVGISRYGLTQTEKNTVRDSAKQQALDVGADKELAEAYGKTIARVRDQITKRFQREAALRRLKYYQKALEQFIDPEDKDKKKRPPTDEKLREIAEEPAEEKMFAVDFDGKRHRIQSIDPDAGEIALPGGKTLGTGQVSSLANDKGEVLWSNPVNALGELAASESEPLEVEIPAFPLTANTPQEVENSVTETMLKNLAEARKRREENKELREEARKDAILLRAVQEGEDPLDKILRTQDRDAAKGAVDAFNELQKARAEKGEIMKIIPPKLPRPETAVVANAVEQMRLKAVEAVDDAKIKEAEKRYREAAQINLDESFYAVVHEHWNEEDGYLLNGGEQAGAADYLNAILKRKKGFVSGAAAAALTGLIGRHTGLELDVGRLCQAFSPAVAASIVGHWLVGLARTRQLKDKGIGAITDAIEQDNAENLLQMEDKALARDRELKNSYQKIRQQRSNGELAAEATIMRLEAENIIQRRENIGRAFGSLSASGTLLLAMKHAQQGIDERLSVNVGSSRENIDTIIRDGLGIKSGKLPPQFKITQKIIGMEKPKEGETETSQPIVQYQISGNASDFANTWGKSQPIVSREMKELEKIKSSKDPVVPTDRPPHFKPRWVDDAGKEDYFNLKASQRNDINFLRKMGGGLITRATGAGKTFTHLGYVSHLLKANPKGKHVIIVPDGLTEQWESQGNRATDLPIVRIPEKQDKDSRAKLWSQVKEGQIVVVSHSDALKSQSDIDWITKHGFESCAIDEPQQLKSQTSQRLGTAAKRIINLPFKHRVGLTATPARESMDEIYDWTNWATKKLDGFDKRERPKWKPQIGSKVGFGRMYAGAGAGTNAQDEAIKALIFQKLSPFMSGDDFKNRNYKVTKATHEVKKTSAQTAKQKEIEAGFGALKDQITAEEKAKAKKTGKGNFYVQHRVNHRLMREMSSRHWNNLHGGDDNGKTAGVMKNIKQHIAEGKKTHIIYVDSDAQRVSIANALRKEKFGKQLYDLTELNKRAKFKDQAEKVAADRNISMDQAIAQVVAQRKEDWAAHKAKGEPSFIFIDRTSQAGHNLQKGDVLSIAGRPEDAAALFQIMGRGDRDPREDDFHVDTYRYSDSPWEDNHWQELDNQMKIVEAITPALVKSAGMVAGIMVKSFAQRVAGERILEFFGGEAA